jgi:hypothetical protein
MDASAGGQKEKGLRQQVEQLFADTDESVTLTMQVRRAGMDRHLKPPLHGLPYACGAQVVKRGKDAMNVMKHMQILLYKDKVLPPAHPAVHVPCFSAGEPPGAKQAHRTQGEGSERHIHAGTRKCALCITVRRSATTRKFKVRLP